MGNRRPQTLGGGKKKSSKEGSWRSCGCMEKNGGMQPRGVTQIIKKTEKMKYNAHELYK